MSMLELDPVIILVIPFSNFVNNTTNALQKYYIRNKSTSHIAEKVPNGIYDVKNI